MDRNYELQITCPGAVFQMSRPRMMRHQQHAYILCAMVCVRMLGPTVTSARPGLGDRIGNLRGLTKLELSVH